MSRTINRSELIDVISQLACGDMSKTDALEFFEGTCDIFEDSDDYNEEDPFDEAEEEYIMSDEEKDIIERAVRNAVAFGSGILTNCMNELEDHGYDWEEERYEQYIFEVYKPIIDNTAE